MSLTYNTLQPSQPSYLRQLFTIQPPRSIRSSSTLTLLRPSVTSSLKFASPPAISVHSSFISNSKHCSLLNPGLIHSLLLPPSTSQLQTPSTITVRLSVCLTLLISTP